MSSTEENSGNLHSYPEKYNFADESRFADITIEPLYNKRSEDYRDYDVKNEVTFGRSSRLSSEGNMEHFSDLDLKHVESKCSLEQYSYDDNYIENVRKTELEYHPDCGKGKVPVIEKRFDKDF